MDTPDLPRLAELDLSDVLPDADYPIRDLENFNPKASLASGPFILTTVAAYGIEGDDGIDRLDRLVRKWATEAEGQKFNKTDVWYQPIAPPPGAWDYRCRNCRYYRPGDERGDHGGCTIVGHEEDPFGGKAISPEAWCALWLPKDGTEFLSYAKRRLEGREV